MPESLNLCTPLCSSHLADPSTTSAYPAGNADCCAGAAVPGFGVGARPSPAELLAARGWCGHSCHVVDEHAHQ
eukprot:scaffold11766_cov23-Tisochrysis_lutea.AAC.3